MKKEEYQLMADQQQWHWWYQTKRRYLDQLLRTLDLPPKAKILDLGSGVGANFPLLRRFGAVSGAEYSKEGRELTRRYHPEAVVAADLNTFSPKKNEYDVITILDVLYHQNIKSDEAVLKKAVTGLKNGGYLVVTDCAQPWLFGPHDVSNMARQRYRKSELEQKVSQSGCKILRSSYLFGFSFPLFAGTRLFQRWKGINNDAKSQNDWLNWVLTQVGGLEAKIFRYLNIPLGSSIVVLAQKV